MAQPRDPVFLENRFGLGVKRAGGTVLSSNDLSRGYDPQPASFMNLGTRADVALAFEEFKASRRARRQARNNAMQDEADKESTQQDYRAARQDIVGLYRHQVAARYAQAVQAENSFGERLVHFWSNHFAVSADNIPMTVFAGLQEQEAIRPHVFGNFADMLMAVEHHPAMLIYLNQSGSIGPNSKAGQRRATNGRKQSGLNENLGREILELHTMGAQGGYNQNDVTELARALTGFTVAGAGGQQREPGAFRFAMQQHEPGTRTILGKGYAQDGEAQANAVLADLAVHPAAAKHLSFKLARHFVADVPPPALVDRLAKTFVAGRGDLTGWYQELLNSPEARTGQAAKYKTPWEWVVSVGRGAGLEAFPRPQYLVNLLNQLGQPVWKPKSPAGYDDVAASWLASDALMRRVEAVPRLIALAPNLPDARELAPKLLGSALRPETQRALARAEDNSQAMALLFVSPEFLRR